MKNVTLSLDEASLLEARRIAANRSTSVNAMIREFLDQLTERESQARAARKRIVKLSRQSRAQRGAAVWSREDLHAR